MTVEFPKVAACLDWEDLSELSVRSYALCGETADGRCEIGFAAAMGGG